MAGERNGIETWKVPEVLQFLQKNDLGALAPVFEEHEVTGLDLQLLTQDELRSMLNISKLQAIKIKNLVDVDAGIDTAQATLAEDDPSNGTDYVGSPIPRISDRREDLGDDEEQSEIGRAGAGVSLQPAVPTTAAVTAGLADVQLGAGAVAAGADVRPAVRAAPTVVGTIIGSRNEQAMLPPGTGALRLDADTVQRYKTSVVTISTLEAEQVAQLLPAARSRLASLQKRLNLQKEKFEELRKEEAKRNEKLDKLVDGKWYPGKYLLGTKRHEAKVDRTTEKLGQVSNQVRAAGAQLEELYSAVDGHTQQVSELTAKCASLDQARNFCSSLLQSAFAGMAVGDARENQLEAEVASLGPQLEEVRRYKAVYGKAYELMRGSREAIDNARQLLETASALATVDMMGNVMRPRPMSNSPGGLMVDMIKRARWRQAVELCKMSADLALKARAMVPDMPRIKAEKLQSLRVGFGLMDVVFDNMISDMIVAARIRKMLGTLRDVESDIKYAERWLEGWIKGRIDEDKRNLEAQLSAKRTELHNHRTMLMQQWIEARERGAALEAAPQAPAAMGVPMYGYVL